MAENHGDNIAPEGRGQDEKAPTSAHHISTATPAEMGIGDDFNEMDRLEVGLPGGPNNNDITPTHMHEGEEGLDDTELYKYTFGRSQGTNINLNAATQSAARDERDDFMTETNRDMHASNSSPRARQSSSNFSEEDSEARDVYATSLTPRKAKRRSLSKPEAPTSPKPASLGMLDFGAREQASTHSRGEKTRGEQGSRHVPHSSDDSSRRASSDSQRRYRSNERALEAQKRQEKFPLVMTEEESLPSSSDPTDRQERLTPRLSIPRRSSSQSRGKSRPNRTSAPTVPGATSHLRVSSASQQPSPHTRKGNVTFRNRALSEPASSHSLKDLYALATLRQETSATTPPHPVAADGSETDRLKPTRSRPLSLPAGSAGTGQFVDKRQSAGARSSGMASSGVMPWDPALSTALSLRQATGEVAVDQNAEQFGGEAERPLVRLGALLQDRAQARYHLGALSAMRARLPSSPSADLKALQYTSWLPRLHHTFLALILYAHVVATIFLDYNSLYSIVQVALYPDSSGSGSSAAWWIASGIYAAALIVWFVGVVVIWDYAVQYRRRWSNARPFALPIYLSAASFNLTAIRSMSLYSLLFRARLSADRRDFMIESFWFYSQNWPTVLTLLPRGVILTVFLVIYNPNSSPNAAQGRDTVYFDPETGRLTSFSFIVLLINVAWMAWRVAILLLSYGGLLITLGPRALYRRERTMYEWHDSESSLTPLPRGLSSTRKRDAKAEAGPNLQDYRYSTVEMQATPQDERDAGLSAPSHGQQRSSTIAPSTPHGWTVQLPDWAWRGRAEERIKALLLQSATYDAESQKERKEWPQSPEPIRDVEAQETQAMLGAERDQRVPMSQRPDARSVTVQSVFTGDLSDFEMVPTRPWVGDEAEPRASGSSRGSASFDRLRTQPRLVVTNSGSPLPPVAGSARSAPSAASSTTNAQRTKGKDRQTHILDSSDPSLSDSPPFASRADSRPISGITVSSVSEATVRPTSLYAPQASEQQVYPFPVPEGDATPEREEMKTTRGREMSESSENATPGAADNTAAGVLATNASSAGRKRRTSSSLSSLSESLGFGRSSKNVDQIDQGAHGDTRERMPVSGKGEGAWWSNWIRPKPTRSSAAPAASISSDDANAEVLLEDDGEAAGEEAADDVLPPGDSERGSMRTHETATSEDSEERRLWSLFPEQSRRFPPGLIALEMEQRRLSQEEERRREEERNPTHAERGGQGASLYETTRDGGDSPRKSGEGLVPIKEESWSSSLDSASNESQ